MSRRPTPWQAEPTLVLTQFWFDKSIRYPEVISSHRLPIHYPEDGELSSQRVHHEGQVPLTYLRVTTGLARDGVHHCSGGYGLSGHRKADASLLLEPAGV